MYLNIVPEDWSSIFWFYYWYLPKVSKYIQLVPKNVFGCCLQVQNKVGFGTGSHASNFLWMEYYRFLGITEYSYMNLEPKPHKNIDFTGRLFTWER